MSDPLLHQSGLLRIEKFPVFSSFGKQSSRKLLLASDSSGDLQGGTSSSKKLVRRGVVPTSNPFPPIDQLMASLYFWKHCNSEQFEVLDKEFEVLSLLKKPDQIENPTELYSQLFSRMHFLIEEARKNGKGNSEAVQIRAETMMEFLTAKKMSDKKLKGEIKETECIVVNLGLRLRETSHQTDQLSILHAEEAEIAEVLRKGIARHYRLGAEYWAMDLGLEVGKSKLFPEIEKDSDLDSFWKIESIRLSDSMDIMGFVIQIPWVGDGEHFRLGCRLYEQSFLEIGDDSIAAFS